MSFTLSYTISGRPYTFTITPDHGYDPNLELICSLQLGIPDPEIVHLINKVVRPGDRVLDGGANIGYFTLAMSQAVGPNGRVISVEPDPKNVYRLLRNIEANKCQNVSVIRSPLWGEEKQVQLHVSDNGGVNSLMPHDQTTDQLVMDAVTLRDYLPLRFIKLDIEGAEADVLSVLKSPEECPYVVAEVNETALARFNQNSAGFRNLMANKGYSTFLMSRDGSMPVLVPPNTRLACTRANTNLLFSSIGLVGQAWSLIAV